MLRVIVLGAAAGGGIPQWNCGCRICRAARSDHPALQSTQTSIAVSADDIHWYLINAAPDLRQQVVATPRLHPSAGLLRHTPIAGVVLTNGEVDAGGAVASIADRQPVPRFKSLILRRGYAIAIYRLLISVMECENRCPQTATNFLHLDQLAQHNPAAIGILNIA